MYEPDLASATVGIKEAAQFLGFKSTSRLSAKAKRGEIPGAFKAAKCWRFIKKMLVEHAYDLENRNRKTAQVDTGRDEACRLAKRKIVHIGTPDSRSLESECKNLRKQLREQTRNSMKKSVGVK